MLAQFGQQYKTKAIRSFPDGLPTHASGHIDNLVLAAQRCRRQPAQVGEVLPKAVLMEA